jgi:hypothetical protein
MRLRIRLCVALGLAAAAGAWGPLPAQGAAAANTAEPTDTTCTYERCALWLDGARLVRGARAELVAKPGWFRSPPLARFVSGDSAGWYAARYERASGRANALSNVGTLAMLGAIGIAYLRDRGCDSGPYPWVSSCRDGDALHVTTAVMFTGGMVALYGSIPFSRRAGRHRARALWWHNAQFAR